MAARLVKMTRPCSAALPGAVACSCSATGAISVLGYEREQGALQRWTMTAP